MEEEILKTIDDGTNLIEIKPPEEPKKKRPSGLIFGTIAFFSVVFIGILSLMGLIGVKTVTNPTQQFSYANDQKLEKDAEKVIYALNSYYEEYKQLPWDVTYEYSPPEKIGNPPKSVRSYKWINELTGTSKLRNPEFLGLDKLVIWTDKTASVNSIKVCFTPDSEDYKNIANTDEVGNSITEDGESAVYYCVLNNK